MNRGREEGDSLICGTEGGGEGSRLITPKSVVGKVVKKEGKEAPYPAEGRGRKKKDLHFLGTFGVWREGKARWPHNR